MRPILLAACLALAACDATAPSGDLTVTTDRDRYAPVSDIAVTVANESDASAFVGQCGGRVVLELQRREDDAWTTVQTLNQPCQAIYLSSPLELAAGEARDDVFSVWTAGTYRLAISYGRGAALIERRAVSEPFEVVGL